MVLDTGVGSVADLLVLHRAAAGEGRVGEEDLVAHAFVLVEQGQLGDGVGALAADDDAGAVRVAGEVDQAGQLGDLGPIAQGPVLLQRGVPDLVGQEVDGLADRFGYGVSDGEAGADPKVPQPTEVGEEGFPAAGGVGTDGDLGALAVGVGDLCEGLIQDGDVASRGVRSGVAWSQDGGEGLAGVVQETQQWVIAEARACRWRRRVPSRSGR